jgi:hypothetical protein
MKRPPGKSGRGGMRDETQGWISRGRNAAPITILPAYYLDGGKN